jgi:dihydropyrimidinase
MRDLMALQLLIKNGLCVNAEGVFSADIAVQDGKIAVIGNKLDLVASRTIDAGGSYILPGLIDGHVHLPWPSARASSVDNYESGTSAAICGGVTTTIEYVVPDDQGRILPALENQSLNAVGSSFADFAFHLIINHVTDDTFREMRQAVASGVVSFKIYTAYTGFRLEDDDILRVLDQAKALNALVCFHAEDGLMINFATQKLVERGCTDVSYYPEAHPVGVDTEATYRMLHYARFTGARIHIVHVNTLEAAHTIGAARRAGQRVSGETCPQYLMFTEDVFKTGKPEANFFVLAPLMRSEEDRQSLWDALATEELQMVASDHCPYTSAQKLEGKGDFRNIPGGAAGIETSLPLLYTYGVCEGRFPIERLAAVTSANPAKIFNLYPKKGTIAVGSDADLVILDGETRSKIDVADLHSKIDHTLYQGIEVTGRPRATILRGEVVVEDNVIVASKPGGEFIPRKSYPQV